MVQDIWLIRCTYFSMFDGKEKSLCFYLFVANIIYLYLFNFIYSFTAFTYYIIYFIYLFIHLLIHLFVFLLGTCFFFPSKQCVYYPKPPRALARHKKTPPASTVLHHRMALETSHRGNFHGNPLGSSGTMSRPSFEENGKNEGKHTTLVRCFLSNLT